MLPVISYDINDIDCNNYFIYDCVGAHRDTRYYDLIIIKEPDLIGSIIYPDPLIKLVDGHRMVICRLALDDNWWIVPCSPQSNPDIDDIGPFKTMGDAIFHITLVGTQYK